MNLQCPKCSKWFELSTQCSKTERFDVSGYLACPKCGYLLPSLEFVGVSRWSEFLEWVNNHNARVVEGKKKTVPPKALWEVTVYDRSLKNVLLAEGLLKDCIADPSLRLVVRCSEKPDNAFILVQFKKYLNEKYERGYIDPIIRVQFMSTAENGKYFDL